MPSTSATSDRGAGITPAGAERRLHVRHAAVGQTECRPMAVWSPEQSKWQARIYDVSLGGIGLVLPRRFERGTGLAIEVPGPGGGHTVFARVVRVARQGDDSWLIGCAFVGELSEDEVRALVGAGADPQGRPENGAATGPAPSDARPDLSALGPMPAPAAGRVVEDVRFRVILPGGRTLNRRVRRLRLPGSWPLRPGSTVQAWAGRKTPQRKTLALRVRACERDGQGWVVTCEAPGVSAADARRWLHVHTNGEGD